MSQNPLHTVLRQQKGTKMHISQSRSLLLESIYRFQKPSTSPKSKLFNQDTILQYTQIYLYFYAATSNGNNADKPMIGTLVNRVGSNKFWAKHYMRRFHDIEKSWRAQLTSHVYALALEFSFNRDSFRPKHDLTNVELGLFFQRLYHFQSSKDYWRQSYMK